MLTTWYLPDSSSILQSAFAVWLPVLHHLPAPLIASASSQCTQHACIHIDGFHSQRKKRATLIIGSKMWALYDLAKIWWPWPHDGILIQTLCIASWTEQGAGFCWAYDNLPVLMLCISSRRRRRRRRRRRNMKCHTRRKWLFWCKLSACMAEESWVVAISATYSSTRDKSN